MTVKRGLSSLLTALTVAGLISLGSGPARASIIPAFVSNAANGDGTFTFNYRADLSQDEKVVPSGGTVQTTDFLTVYDFAGLLANSITTSSTDWVATVQNIGITPPNTLPTDDPSLPNVTFTYKGSTTVLGPQSPLFTFSMKSYAGPGGLDSFAAQATRATGGPLLIGTKIQNVGQLEAPMYAPEPASLALLGIGAPIAIALIRRRKSA